MLRTTQAPGIPKCSAEDTSLVIGNEAGETTMLPIPAGSRVIVDVVGLHYNRKSHLPQQAYSGGSRRATQQGIGTTHFLSNQIASWGNGTRMLSSLSPGVQGDASGAGNPLWHPV